MTAFLETVRSLGVTLNVYKNGEKLEWTSLLGGEKRLLLKKLPEKFGQFLPASKVEKTRNLWIVSFINLMSSDFATLFDIFSKIICLCQI